MKRLENHEILANHSLKRPDIYLDTSKKVCLSSDKLQEKLKQLIGLIDSKKVIGKL